VCSSIVAVGFSSSQQLVRDDISLAHDEGSVNGARRSQEDNSEGDRDLAGEIWREEDRKGIEVRDAPSWRAGSVFVLHGEEVEGGAGIHRCTGEIDPE
jgi:hypothetical protein